VTPQPALHTPYQIKEMERGAVFLHELFVVLRSFIQPGTSGREVDRVVADSCRRAGVRAALKGYKHFPASACVNLNNVAAHGVPDDRKFIQGDVVTVDCVVETGGWYADAAWTYGVGTLDTERQRLLQAGWKATRAGALASAGGVQAIARAVQTSAKLEGCLVLPRFAGHCIGRAMHEEPLIPYVEGESDGKFETGLVFTVEPILVCDHGVMPAVTETKLGWILPDECLSVQFEVMVAIEASGPRILGFPPKITGLTR